MQVRGVLNVRDAFHRIGHYVIGVLERVADVAVSVGRVGHSTVPVSAIVDKRDALLHQLVANVGNVAGREISTQSLKRAILVELWRDIVQSIETSRLAIR